MNIKKESMNFREMAKIKSSVALLLESESVVYIADTSNNDPKFKTITNDAENVVAALDLNNRRLYYKDSMGRIDEIIHKDGVFAGFKPCDLDVATDLEDMAKEYAIKVEKVGFSNMRHKII